MRRERYPGCAYGKIRRKNAFSNLRDNINSVVCDAVVDTSAGPRNYAASLGANVAGNHPAYEEFGTIRIGKYKLAKSRNGSLPYVIHIPIPSKLRAFTGPYIVRRCYRRALRIVSNYHFKSVVFPLIGGECDGLPKEAALEIASHEIKRFLADHANTNIILVISNDDAFRPDPALLSGLSEYLLYIEEQERQKRNSQCRWTWSARGLSLLSHRRISRKIGEKRNQRMLSRNLQIKCARNGSWMKILPCANKNMKRSAICVSRRSP